MTRTAEEMREVCWETNQRMKRIGASRWYWISERYGVWRMELLDGADVDAIWAFLRDKPVVPPGWVEYRFRKWHSRLLDWLQRGMEYEAFAKWNSDERKDRRKAYIASEVKVLRELYPNLYEGELL